MLKYLFLFVSCIFFLSCTKEIIQYKLTVSASPVIGGSVTPPSNSYEKGQSLQILATPTGEYLFKEWQGDLSGASNPSTLVIDKDKVVIGTFEKRQYPLNLTIVGSGIVKEEIVTIATLSQYPTGTIVRLTPQPMEGWVFGGWSGDLTSSINPLDVKVVKPISLNATFTKLSLSSIKIENSIDTLVISKKHKFIIKGVYTNGTMVDLSNSVNVTLSTQSANVLEGNELIGVKSGNTNISITYNDLTIDKKLFVSEIEEVKNFDTYLSTPVNGAKLIVPVIVINYYATKNGIDIDTQKQPTYGSLDPITIDNLKLKTIEELKLTKYGLEEGSKFRGFSNTNSIPNVGFKVIKYYNVYEINKVMSADKINYFVDFNDMFSKLNIKDAVNLKGVKEIWFSLRPLSSEYPIIKTENLSPDNFQAGGQESNMSSPTSGDISNSWRISNDLPIYDKSYVVYTYNLHRSHAENIHNHGHQIEAQLDHLDRGVFSKDERLFLNKFVGISNISFGGKPFGRNGMTHFPPNTKLDYDWNNPAIVKSDIEDWKPEGGIQKEINNTRWMSIKYNYPTVSYKVDENDSQFKWILFWFQTIPGVRNGINYGNFPISNWWDLFYNWDDAVKNKKTLWEE